MVVVVDPVAVAVAEDDKVSLVLQSKISSLCKAFCTLDTGGSTVTATGTTTGGSTVDDVTATALTTTTTTTTPSTTASTTTTRYRLQEYKEETLLCGLLLWTRIPNDNVYCQIAKSDETKILVLHALDILDRYRGSISTTNTRIGGTRHRSTQQEQQHKQQQLRQYLKFSMQRVRLVAQIVSRFFLIWIQAAAGEITTALSIDDNDNNVSTTTTTMETAPSQQLHNTSLDDTDTIWKPHVTHLLIQILQFRRDNGEPVDGADVDILRALRNQFWACSFSSSSTRSPHGNHQQKDAQDRYKDDNKDDAFFLAIWKIYKCSMNTVLLPSQLQSSDKSPPSSRVGHNDDEDDDDNNSDKYTDKDFQLMVSTVEALLSQNAAAMADPTEMEGDDNKKDYKREQRDATNIVAWQETIWEILQPPPPPPNRKPSQSTEFSFSLSVSSPAFVGADAGHARSMRTLPTFWGEALEWWLEGNNKTTTKIRNDATSLSSSSHKQRDRKVLQQQKEDKVPLFSPLVRAKWAWLLLYHVHVNHHNKDNDDDGDDEIHLCLLSSSSSSNSNSSSNNNKLLLTSPELLSLFRLILIVVVAPNNDSLKLRPLAWTVARYLWSSLSSLSKTMDLFQKNGQILNSLLRLAVGELRIQLHHLLMGETTVQNKEETICAHKEKEDDDDDDENDGNELIVLACGQIVTQTVNWIREMDETQQQQQPLDDDDYQDGKELPPSSFHMTQSSIQHIHDSLEQTLELCVEYFEKVTTTTRQNKNNNSIRALPLCNTTMLGILGSLLTEFDVFRHQLSSSCSSSNDDMNIRSNKDHGDAEPVVHLALIRALGQAMVLTSCSSSFSSSNCDLKIRQSCLLLPGVTTVLASAQGDPDRVQLLIDQWDNNIIDNGGGTCSSNSNNNNVISGFVETFWQLLLQSDDEFKNTNQSSTKLRDQQNDQVKSVVWMCQLMEVAAATELLFPQQNGEASNQLFLRIWKDKLITYLTMVIRDTTTRRTDGIENTADDDSAVQQRAALEAVVGCYVTLQGETTPPPSDSLDAMILQETWSKLLLSKD